MGRLSVMSSNIQRLFCVLIGCSFYRAVLKRMFICTNLAIFWLAKIIKMRSDPTPNNGEEMSCSMFFFQEMQFVFQFLWPNLIRTGAYH